MTLLGKIKSINCGILEMSGAVVTKIILFGYNTHSVSSNILILNSTVDYVRVTKRFDASVLTHGI